MRVAYVLAVTRDETVHLYDEVYYLTQSRVLATGHGFQTFSGGGPQAAHPPLTVLVATPASWFYGLPRGFVPQRLSMAVLGAIAVGIIGLVGLLAAGPRVGILAAGIAGVYPNLVMPSGLVMSEGPSILMTALIVLTFYRLLRSPTVISAALAGLACGVGALARAELAILALLLLVGVAVALRSLDWWARAGRVGVVVVVASLTVGPWVVRNLTTFREPTYLSTADGAVFLGANCDATYGDGALLGAWSSGCAFALRLDADPSVVAKRERRLARTYVQHHLGRLPVVMAARVGRLWDVFRPFQTARTEVLEGRPIWASWSGLGMFWVLVPLAYVGVVLKRRGQLQWPLLVAVGLVTALAAATYGAPRFRAPAEVSIVVLAAVGLDAGWRSWSKGQAARTEAPIARPAPTLFT